MKLYHVTSPEIAESLLEHPVFLASQLSDNGDDVGLNAYSFRRGYFLDQVPRNRGVKLVMEWTGKVKRSSITSSKNMSHDTLYVQYPWRCMLVNNEQKGQLRILGILPDKSGKLDEFLNIREQNSWGSMSQYYAFAKQKRTEYIRSYWQRCKASPVWLTVTDQYNALHNGASTTVRSLTGSRV